MISRRRLDNEKHGGGTVVQFVSRNVVELNESHVLAVRPQVEIETVGERRLEQSRDRAVEIGRADAGNVDRVEPVGVSGCGRGPPSDCRDLRKDRGRRGLPSPLVQVT